MNEFENTRLFETRRHFFGKAAGGIGSAALASLLNPGLFAGEGNVSNSVSPNAPNPAMGGLPELPHFAPKAKRVIYLFMSGAPSQLDMWDY